MIPEIKECFECNKRIGEISEEFRKVYSKDNSKEGIDYLINRSEKCEDCKSWNEICEKQDLNLLRDKLLSIGSREVYIKNEIMEKIVKIFEQCMDRVKDSTSQYCTFCYATLTDLIIDNKYVCTLKYENFDFNIFPMREYNGCINSICDSCANYEWGNDNISFINKERYSVEEDNDEDLLF